MMRHTMPRILVGLVVAVIYVLSVGYLTVQADAIDSGVSLTWQLEPKAVREPQSPFLQLVAVASAGFLALLLLYVPGRDRRGHAMARACALALAAMFVAGTMWGGAPTPTFMEVSAHGLGGVLTVGATSTAALTLWGCIAAIEMLARTGVVGTIARRSNIVDRSDDD